MLNRKMIAALLMTAATAMGQSSRNSSRAELTATMTLPVVFTNSVSANHSRIGDIVTAKTSQQVRLANGSVVPAGTKVTGHILAANAFVYDKTPYAQQKQSVLSIQFDAIEVGGTSLPLKVTVRAMADPVTSNEARTPMASDVDPWGTVTQIGGDQLTPSQREVTSSEGDVVAYNKRGGVYAHLIASGRCDGNSIEVPMGIYSASACGLYGFAEVAAPEMGSVERPSTLTLVSTHVSPKIWKNSTALLEVLPESTTEAAR